MWKFPKIMGTLLGVPIIRILVFWGSILGSPYFGKLPCHYSYYDYYFMNIHIVIILVIIVALCYSIVLVLYIAVFFSGGYYWYYCHCS